ncbi:MAG: hypothetical protein GKR91_20665 [Pseudomonadales bacterium]|nr:hypothetical protein [Pseudomonadales bacterium]
MSTPIVFIDIAGPEDSSLKEFYAEVFDWEIGPGGNFTTTVASPSDSPPSLMGTIRTDPTEKVFYLGVEDISAKLEEVVGKGGEIDQPRFEVPGVVILGLFRDPAGNRVGLVEMENGMAKVPGS